MRVTYKQPRATFLPLTFLFIISWLPSKDAGFVQ